MTEILRPAVRVVMEPALRLIQGDLRRSWFRRVRVGASRPPVQGAEPRRTKSASRATSRPRPAAFRTSVIRAALDWLTAIPERTKIFAACPAEVAINKVMDGDFGYIPGLRVPYALDALDVRVRAEMQRTFIWGPIGEDRYIRHIGTDARDQAGDHARGPIDLAETRRAWQTGICQSSQPLRCLRNWVEPQEEQNTGCGWMGCSGVELDSGSLVMAASQGE